MPKVRSLKNSASRERTSIRHREAVLGFISQLDVNELSLFFALLMKPLNIISDEATDLFWSSGKSSLDYFQRSKFSKYINVDALSTLSWKMKSGFLHVIQHILEVFDVFHVRPFLDFLMGCVVRLLVNNAPNIDEESNNIDKEIVSTNHDQAGTSLKQFKELRSLCLKIIARVLKKYEDCDLGSEFWDLFFSAVNPLIKSFKQEGSSSEKPSSLFTCFLSMSKSPNLVTFLCREESLVPDIFSIPTVTTASEAIKSSALSFIKNLLSLEKDMEDDDHMNKGFLNPYIDALINNLHSLFRGDILRRKSFKYHGEREIKILKLLSKHIRDESHVMKYLNILLSFLDKRVKYSDIHREALLAIQDITSLLGSESTNKIIDTVSLLLVDAKPDVRLCICNLLESLAKIDSSLDRVAKCVSDMNATSPMKVDDLDYETIMDAYAKIDVDFLNESSEQHMMIILSQTSLLCQEASAHSDIGKEVSKSVARWTGDRVLWIMNKFILKHIGDAVNNGISCGKGEILLIRKMVMRLPDSGNLSAFRPLCSENDDLDFFKNVFNIQAHRRAKAINSFAKEIKDSSLPEGVVRKLLVSIFFNMLLEGQERKDENVLDACEEALASLSAHMSWTSYYALLKRCFREMKQHTDKSKRLLDLVCLILDKFHFAEGGEAHEEIRGCLDKTLYPKITKLFDSESDGVNFNAYVAAVKCLPSPTGWKLDHCLEDLLDVVEADILGDVDEQKEDKKDSMNKRKKKMETRKRKSLDTLRLIAENVTFRSHALTLLSPKNLSYEHSTGREAVLDVLQKLIHKFPDPSPGKQSKPCLGHQSVVHQQSQNLFIELALHLERENDQKLLAKICVVIKLLIGCMTNYKSSLKLSLGWYKQENSRVRGAKVLRLFIEAEKKFPEKKCSILLKEAKTILEAAVKLQNTVEEGSIPLWKEAYYSLIMIEKMLTRFPHLCFREDSKDVWTMVFKLLLHRHEWLQTTTCRLLHYYFKKLAESTQAESLLGKPSSLFMVAASLCFQLKLKVDRNRVINKNNDTTEEDYLRENLVFAVTGLHSMIGQTDDEYWSSLDSDEQAKFMEAFLVFDSGKVRSTFLSLTSSGDLKGLDDVRNVLVGSLLKRMGKLAFDVDSHQMRIVFNVYKEFASNLNQEECRLYAFRILLPLYKVCQGFTGKAITDELEQLAEEVRDGIRDKSLGVQMFVKVYSEIKKSLEVKRQKRRREEKEMAVVNPERNAKRKLKVASKNKANKKRRMMRSKMDRWSRS
ncbi:BnaA09g29450D [Brassica napus]|uniref:BnaA09g29450D protein n=1 Tax=Brassica napus TaxID=3708 RepID=A0A078FSZ5_BRANA|nr:BnaA09g29450D [Brassica napus]